MNTHNQENNKELIMSIFNKKYEILEELAKMRFPITYEIKNYYLDIEKKNIALKERLDKLKSRIDEFPEKIDRFLKESECSQRKTFNMLFFFDVVSPLMMVIGKIIEYKEYDIILFENYSKYKITTSETYDVLKKLSKEYAISLLKQIPCSFYCYEAIMDSFNKNNKDDFVKTIKENKCDITALSVFCYLKRIEIEISAFLDVLKNGFVLSHEEYYSCLEKIQSYDYYPTEVKEIINFFEIDIEPQDSHLHIINNSERILLLYIKFILNILKHEENKFSFLELNLIKKILHNPEYTDIYNYYLEIIKNDETNNDSETDKTFTLSDKYFKIRQGEPETYIAEIKKTIENSGVDVFVKFIIYLAESGYIDNNLKVLNTFAYRITGRDLKVEYIEVIEWKRNLNALGYVIKHFYPRGKFKEASKFFSYKNSSTNQSIPVKLESSFADIAPMEFKEGVKELYPDIEKK